MTTALSPNQTPHAEPKAVAMNGRSSQFALFCKLLRDVRWPLIIVGLLLAAYLMLWAKITEQITMSIMPFFMELAELAMKTGKTLKEVESRTLRGMEIFRAMLGGDLLNLNNPMSTYTISYVHPFTQIVLSLWCVGRAAGALTGEIERGTMELLLAQPIARWRVPVAHLLVDVVTIPVLCACVWLGTWLGPMIVGLKGVDALRFIGGVVNMMALMFAMTGITLALSALGRSRWKVMGFAMVLMLAQFLLNLFGQMWGALRPYRQFTIYYFYQPQPIILENSWMVPYDLLVLEGRVMVIPVLLAVGLVGYGLAVVLFSRRDLPAPL
jgi:ABC-2 type transport system permease protein